MSCIIFLFFFFFYCAGVHRDLHSFPTRRSSDLRSLSGSRTLSIATIRSAKAWITAISSPKRKSLTPLRSEEHTSELQSRGHLVCRLLLEKKKKKKTQ